MLIRTRDRERDASACIRRHQAFALGPARKNPRGTRRSNVGRVLVLNTPPAMAARGEEPRGRRRLPSAAAGLPPAARRHPITAPQPVQHLVLVHLGALGSSQHRGEPDRQSQEARLKSGVVKGWK